MLNLPVRKKGVLARGQNTTLAKAPERTRTTRLVILATQRASVAASDKLYKKEYSGFARVRKKQFNQAIPTSSIPQNSRVQCF